MSQQSSRPVWIINQSSISPRESGGTRHYSLARELKKHGYDATVIASANNYYTGKPRPLPEGVGAQLEEIEGVSFLWLRSITKDKKMHSRIIAMLYYLWQVLSGKPQHYLPRPALIMGSSPTLFNAVAACILAKRYRVPFVLEIRDLWPESLIEITGHGRYHPLVVILRFLEGWVYRNASHIVTLLDKSTLYFSAWGVPPERVSVVSNGVDLQLLDAQAVAPPTDKEHFTILYMGAMGRPNAMDTVVEAAALLQDEPRIAFHLVGDGVCRPQLEEMARNLKLTNVRFSPPVPKKEVAQLLAQADATIMHMADLSLYRWGISPNKLYDYLLAARPVLFASGVADNIVSQSGGGMAIPAGSAQQMADTVRKLAALPLLERQEMGRRGREFVLTHYNFGVLGQKLANAFDQCLQRKA